MISLLRPLLLSALLLLGSACAYVPGPKSVPEYTEYGIQTVIHKDFESVNRAYGKEEKVWGFARWQGNQCAIHFILNDWETFIHEVKHCYYGHWHKPLPQDN